MLFVSYSRVDEAIMESLVRYLRRAYTHQSVWVDDNLRGGQTWWDEIARQIQHCDTFILLVSPDSLNSKYCMKELAEARHHGKRIIPVVVRARTNVPPDIKQLHMIKMPKGVEPGPLSDLIAAIGRPPSQPVFPLAQPTRPHRGAVTRPMLGSLVATRPNIATSPAVPPPRLPRWWPVAGLALLSILATAWVVVMWMATSPPDAGRIGSVYVPAMITLTQGTPPQPGLTLYYDEATFYIINEATMSLDASGLTFTQDNRTFHSDDWFGQPLGHLEPGACLQAWTVEFGYLMPPEGCNDRERWRQVAPSGEFWRGDGAFTVQHDGEWLATCPVAAGRCVLPPP